MLLVRVASLLCLLSFFFSGKVIGKQIVANQAVMDKVTNHLETLTGNSSALLGCPMVFSASACTPVDLREPMRRVEQKFLSGPGAGAIIGAQVIDFQKQDGRLCSFGNHELRIPPGVTEIVEAVEANAVERRFNDALFEDEKKGGQSSFVSNAIHLIFQV